MRCQPAGIARGPRQRREGDRQAHLRPEGLLGSSERLHEERRGNLYATQMFLLNFYAKKWKDMNEEVKDNQIAVPQVPAPNAERTLSSILETTDYVGKIRLSGKG